MNSLLSCLLRAEESMKLSQSWLQLCTVVLLLVSAEADRARVSVALDGAADSPCGVGHLRPCNSIGLALNQTQAGDIVYLQDGVYSGPENLPIVLNHPIIISKSVSATNVVIDCSGLSAQQTCVQLNVQEEVVTEGNVIITAQYHLHGLQFRRNKKENGILWSSPIISVQSIVTDMIESHEEVPSGVDWNVQFDECIFGNLGLNGDSHGGSALIHVGNLMPWIGVQFAKTRFESNFLVVDEEEYIAWGSSWHVPLTAPFDEKLGWRADQNNNDWYPAPWGSLIRSTKSASLAFKECEFQNNIADGPLVDVSVSPMTREFNVKDCVFMNNSSPHSHGSQVYLSGSTVKPWPSFQGSEFFKTYGLSTILLNDGAQVSIDDCLFDDLDQGIYAIPDRGPYGLSITQSKFYYTTPVSGQFVPATVSASLFRNIESRLVFRSPSMVQIDSSSFSESTSPILMDGSELEAPFSLLMKNCSFYTNGAIVVSNTPSLLDHVLQPVTVTIQYCSFFRELDEGSVRPALELDGNIYTTIVGCDFTYDSVRAITCSPWRKDPAANGYGGPQWDDAILYFAGAPSTVAGNIELSDVGLYACIVLCDSTNANFCYDGASEDRVSGVPYCHVVLILLVALFAVVMGGLLLLLVIFRRRLHFVLARAG